MIGDGTAVGGALSDASDVVVEQLLPTASPSSVPSIVPSLVLSAAPSEISADDAGTTNTPTNMPNTIVEESDRERPIPAHIVAGKHLPEPTIAPTPEPSTKKQFKSKKPTR